MAISEAYGRVSRGFWTDPDIKRKLSAEQKELLLYYFTGPHSNMSGLYVAPFEFTASLTGLSVEKVRAWTLGCLSPFVSYDEATEEVLVHRLARHQVGDSIDPKDKRLTAINRLLASAHSVALVRHFAALYPDWPVSIPEAPSKPLPSPFEARAVTETETNTGAETETPPPGVRASAQGDLPAVEVGTKVIPLPNQPEPASAAARAIPERVTADQVVSAWIRRRRTRPPEPVIRQQGAVAKRLAKQYTGPQLAQAFIGIEAMFPHCPPPAGRSEPWDLAVLERKFGNALAAAENHPELRRRRAEREFDAILDATGTA